jgi:hypothetical protein
MTHKASQLTQLTVTEAALLVGRRTETIYRGIRNHCFKACQDNGEWKIEQESLLRHFSNPRAQAAKNRAQRDSSHQRDSAVLAALKRGGLEAAYAEAERWKCPRASAPRPSKAGKESHAITAE